MRRFDAMMRSRKMTFIGCLLVSLPLLPPRQGLCQDDMDEPYGPRPQCVKLAQERYEAAKVTYTNNPDVLVLPGLVANRKQRRVEVLAESTGLAAGELAEFLLVDKDSSHGYEAMLWSFAKPSDVHWALIFIGLKPGPPYNPRTVYFRSGGDRVNVTIADSDTPPVPIETMIMDNETEETLPEEGFVFAGSMTIPAPDGKGGTVYVADEYDPRSVASVYNERSAVLDVPRQAPKDELYGRQVVNPDAYVEGGKLLTIVMEPRDPEGRAEPPHTVLSVGSIPGATGLVYRLTGADETLLKEGASVMPVLEQLSGLRTNDIPPYVALSFAAALPVPELIKVCLPVAVMESMGMVQMDPPADDQLYYRSFLPDKAWKLPAGRPTQPWELHLSLSEEKVTGKMVLNEAVWSEGSTEPSFSSRTIDVPAPMDLRAALDADTLARQTAGKSPLPGVLLVFVPPSLTYGQLMNFLKPVKDTHGTVYVFVEE